MANYRPVATEIWRNQDFKHMDAEQKCFFLYLLTNHLTNQCGIYYADTGEMAYYSGIPQPTVETLLRQFEELGLIKYDWNTEELAITSWYKYHHNDSATVITCIKNELENVRSYELVKHLQERCPVPRAKKELLSRQKALKIALNGVSEGCDEGESLEVYENQLVLKEHRGKEKEKEKEKQKEGGKRKENTAAADEFLKNEFFENPDGELDGSPISPPDAEKEKSCAKKEKDEVVVERMKAIWLTRFTDYFWQAHDTRAAVAIHAALKTRSGPAVDVFAAWSHLVENLPAWVIDKNYAEVPLILRKINSIRHEITNNTRPKPASVADRSPQGKFRGYHTQSYSTGAAKYLPHLSKDSTRN